MILISLVLSMLTPPERWIHVGGSVNLYEEYLDKESVRRVGDKVAVWTRRQFVLGQGISWIELEFDCSMRTETILAFVRDDGGTISHNVARPHRKASPIPPDTVAERVFNIACR